MSAPKRLISIVLFTLAVSVFTGCSGSSGGNSQPPLPPLPPLPPVPQKYTVTFNLNVGGSLPSIQVDGGGIVTAPSAPTCPGYNFEGWYSDSTLTDKVNFPYLVTQNITLYANWIEIATEEPLFENAAQYTTGSNQEWALWALSQLDNSAEKIRLYNYLLKAHTYLLVYDKQDYIGQYNAIKNMWLAALPDFDEEIRAQLQLMLDDENWTIDIEYPLENPFKLNLEEYLQVYFYFADANPQFFLNPIVPYARNYDTGFIEPILSIPAYYAFADRRRETYHNIYNKFNNFKLQLELSIDMNNQYHVVKYAYDHVIGALNYNYENYYSREQNDMNLTILGYFGDSNRTICKGYSTILMYLLNRLGIPAIDQGGGMIMRNEYGDITGYGLHAWNMVTLNNNWYFLDATWETAGKYDWFLKGKGENNDSYFLYWHGIAEDMIYPEASAADFSLQK